MLTRATDFFISIVKPTANEFLSNPGDVRRGCIAAIVLYHMLDYWALEGYVGNERKIMDERVEKLRIELIGKCPDFLLIRDVADASKHAQLSVPKKMTRELSSSEQISRNPGIFGAPFGEGVFAEASIVIVTLDDGTSRPLAGAVQSVLSMWEDKLKYAAETKAALENG